jgi:hypothetical protein
MSHPSAHKAAFLAVFISLLAAPLANGQIAVVSARSVDAVLADSRYIARLVGQDAQAKQVEGLLKPFLASKNGSGLDAKRPFGAYAVWPEKVGGLESLGKSVVFFVPVADEKRFLALLEDLSWKPRKTEDDMYRLSVPGAGDYSLRFANGHAYASTELLLLRGKLPELGAFLPPKDSKRLLIASFPIGHYQKEYELFLDIAREAISGFVDKDDKEQVAALGNIQVQLAKCKGFTKHLEAFTLTLEIDPEQNLFAADLAFVPSQPEVDPWGLGKSLATIYRDLGKARSRFSPLARRAPLGMFLHVPIDEKEKKNVSEIPDSVVKGLFAFVDPKYGAFMNLVPVVIKSLQTEGLDFCLTLSAGESKDDLPLLAGLKVPNGRDIDHALRDVFKELPTELKENYAVAWNHARQGDARIHKVTKFFGTDLEVYMAIREDVIFWGNGKQGLKSVKEALGGFNKGDLPATHFFELNVSSAGFLLSKEIAEAVNKTLTTAEREKLSARISLSGGKTLRLRIEASTYVLKLGPRLFAEDGKK